MSKIAVISDIHGNQTALQAVWPRIKSCDFILNAGDLTGYYPDINPVIDNLKNKKIVNILGNHDRHLIAGKLPKLINPSIIKPFQDNLATITKENLRFLKTLKVKTHLVIDGKKIGLFHGSPFNFNEYIFPDNPNLAEFEKLPFEIIIMGHTHWPMVKKINQKLIINPGSIGQPRDYDNRASFILLDTKTLKAELKRIKYDVAKTIRKIEQSGFNQDLIDILIRKKKDE